MIKYLKDIKKEENKLFGGKATNLGFLIQKGFNVPEGFCISTEIYQLNNKIKNEILEKFKTLNSAVSVRSSATCEDAGKISFAGQFDTFLNIKTKAGLFDAIKRCWKSVNSKRVQAYIKNKKIENIKMAVIVQKMIDADFAGVVFTIDPVDKKFILVEIVKGLGDKLVSGRVTPNSYFVNRNNLKIEKKNELFEIDVGIIKRISEVSMKIESSYNLPQDIEFCTKSGKVYILQSRPITTLDKPNHSQE